MRWPPSISSRAPSAACNCPTTTPVERAVSHCCATLQAESLVEQIRQTRDLLEPGPVGIVGFSVGGFMALVAATHLTFEVVVAVYPGVDGARGRSDRDARAVAACGRPGRDSRAGAGRFGRRPRRPRSRRHRRAARRRRRSARTAGAARRRSRLRLRRAPGNVFGRRNLGHLASDSRRAGCVSQGG